MKKINKNILSITIVLIFFSILCLYGIYFNNDIGELITFCENQMDNSYSTYKVECAWFIYSSVLICFGSIVVMLFSIGIIISSWLLGDAQSHQNKNSK